MLSSSLVRRFGAKNRGFSGFPGGDHVSNSFLIPAVNPRTADPNLIPILTHVPAGKTSMAVECARGKVKGWTPTMPKILSKNRGGVFTPNNPGKNQMWQMTRANAFSHQVHNRTRCDFGAQSPQNYLKKSHDSCRFALEKKLQTDN